MVIFEILCFFKLLFLKPLVFRTKTATIYSRHVVNYSDQHFDIR